MSWENFYKSVIDLNDDNDDYGRILYNNRYIYCRSFEKMSRSALLRSKERFHWFAMIPGYGSDDTYGPIVTTWKLTRTLKLLNISTMAQRQKLIKMYDIPDNVLDPDEQYSGGQGNTIAHTALKPILYTLGLDGTYISENEADEECQGASEIVLIKSALQYIRKM